MSSTITGNAGGTAASGASIQASPSNYSQGSIVYGVADTSGNYSIAGLAQGSWIVRALNPSASVTYPVSQQVAVDGVSTYSNVNLTPQALNARNDTETPEQ
jgi:hypothetical protein